MSIPEKTCRIVFLGSGRVGKTCIIHRLLKLPFVEKYRATIEDIYVRDIEKSNDKIQFKVEILDTGGSFHFAGMLALSISKASAFVLVYSVDDRFSLDYVKSLYLQIESKRDDFSSIPICIACNKIDQNDFTIQSPDEMISSLMKEIKIDSSQIILISAKFDESIDQIFHCLWNQNLLKKAVNIPKPKESSNWSILIKRRVSALESLISNNNEPKPGQLNSMLRAKSVCQSPSNANRDIQKLKLHSKQVLKKDPTTPPKEWKKGDVLKIDCPIS